MPEPVRRTSHQRYMPGLDGLRAIAVLAVIAYHLNLDWAQGGLLGVGVFFTLSGYLITDILMEGWTRRTLKLTDFWLARARRLLPGLFLMLVVVMAWVTVADPDLLDELRGQAVSSAFFVSNWWMIFQDVSYFERFGPASPLSHLWSLAVEEQFYIFWPWVLLLMLRFVPLGGGRGDSRRRERVRPRLALICLGLAFVSALLMVLLYDPGFDTTRVYEGTDTRVFALLVGAALAMVWPSRRLTGDIPQKARAWLDGAGVAGLAVIAILIWRTTEYSSFIYNGGLVLLAVATAVVVAVLAHPSARLGKLVGCPPLRWIGVRSYGIYLWQLPIITLTTPPLAADFDPVRALLQVGATLGVSALSWRYLEDPIRKGALGRWWTKLRSAKWRARFDRRRVAGVLAAPALVMLFAFGGLVGIAPSSALLPLAVSSSEGPRVGQVSVSKTIEGRPSQEPKAERDPCMSVAYIGDSTSEGLISPDYLPDPGDRIDAQLTRVGAISQHLDISGARSIVETVSGQPNAHDAAQAIRDTGFEGCWVFGLGTNDTANIFVGSKISLQDRIHQMMSVVGDDPALWINLKTLVSTGPYAEVNMEEWNRSLEDACRVYPNMRIYDWADDVKDEWYIDDGTHFTTPGYRARSRLIADALDRAFIHPEKLPPDSCMIRLGRRSPRS